MNVTTDCTGPFRLRALPSDWYRPKNDTMTTTSTVAIAMPTTNRLTIASRNPSDGR